MEKDILQNLTVNLSKKQIKKLGSNKKLFEMTLEQHLILLNTVMPKDEFFGYVFKDFFSRFRG